MRGTTPIHTFKSPIDTKEIAKVKVAYKYGNEVILIKNTSDCALEENRIVCRLSRNDTVKFPDDVKVKVQLEIETQAGESLKTPVYYIPSGELLDEGELK